MNTVVLNGKEIIPSKIICVGRNYVEHIKELNNEIPEEMVVFVKPNSAINTQLNSFHGEEKKKEALHYECELCFIVENNKLTAVGLGLDLTKRETQSRLKAKGLPWERAKAFDGSAVFSHFVSIDKISDSLSFELKIDGISTQIGNIDLMIYKPEATLIEVQSFMTLNDGDIIMTGTPKGVGILKHESNYEVTLKDNSKTIIEESWIAMYN